MATVEGYLWLFFKSRKQVWKDRNFKMNFSHGLYFEQVARLDPHTRSSLQWRKLASLVPGFWLLKLKAASQHEKGDGREAGLAWYLC